MPLALPDAFKTHALAAGVPAQAIGMNLPTWKALRERIMDWEDLATRCGIAPDHRAEFILCGAIDMEDAHEVTRQVKALVRSSRNPQPILVEALDRALTHPSHPIARQIIPELTMGNRLVALTRSAKKGSRDEIELILPYMKRENVHQAARACVEDLHRASLVDPERLEVFHQLLEKSRFEDLPVTESHLIFHALKTLPDPFVETVIHDAMPRLLAYAAVWTALEEGRLECAAQLRARARRPTPDQMSEWLEHVISDCQNYSDAAHCLSRQQFVQVLEDTGVNPRDPRQMDRVQQALEISPPHHQRPRPL